MVRNALDHAHPLIAVTLDAPVAEYAWKAQLSARALPILLANPAPRARNQHEMILELLSMIATLVSTITGAWIVSPALVS